MDKQYLKLNITNPLYKKVIKKSAIKRVRPSAIFCKKHLKTLSYNWVAI